MIYFDYTATTPINPDVLKFYNKIYQNYWANPSSIHEYGLYANNVLNKSIDTLKEILKVPNHNVIFTSGATESNNLAIMGIALKYVGKHKKIITTKMEHPSVLNVFQYLETVGFDVIYLDIDKEGRIDPSQLEQEIDKNTILVSVMWVSNTVGTIMPIQEVIHIVKKHKHVKLHIDSVQGIGKLIPTFDLHDIDMFTMSAHKFYGPKGIGALVLKEGIELMPLLNGSKQQKGYRPGTVNVPGAASLVKALQLSYEEIETHFKHVKELNERFRLFLSKYDAITIISPEKGCSPYILGLAVPNIKPQTFMLEMQANNCLIATGAACSSRNVKPAQYLMDMGYPTEIGIAGIRISFSHLHEEPDIVILEDAIRKSIEKLI